MIHCKYVVGFFNETNDLELLPKLNESSKDAEELIENELPTGKYVILPILIKE